MQNMPGFPFSLAEILQQNKYNKKSIIAATFLCNYYRIKSNGTKAKYSSFLSKAMPPSLLFIVLKDPLDEEWQL